MELLFALLIALLTVAAWTIMADHREALDWRRPSSGRSFPRTDVNQQWTVVDR